MNRALTLLLFCLAHPAMALDLSLSGASLSVSDENPATSIRMPARSFSEDHPPRQVEGRVTRQVLRTVDGTRTTLQTLAPLRDQLSVLGYHTVFTCANRACGGFDFRFQLDLLPPPEMFVDLGDYRYVLMEKPGADPHTVSILTSRSSVAGFVHLTFVGPAIAPVIDPNEPSIPIETGAADPGEVVSELLSRGFVVLNDLDFGSGSDELTSSDTKSLRSLGAWLIATPGARIALVGHTDSIGDPASNQALSERRAESVRETLLQDFDIAPTRVEASGVGYLAPIAPNTTPEGRARNRRVEVVLINLG